MARKAVMLSVAAFAIFFVLTRPEGAADAVRFAADALVDAFHQVARFFNALMD